jgi:hypothetical protein
MALARLRITSLVLHCLKDMGEAGARAVTIASEQAGLADLFLCTILETDGFNAFKRV